MLRDAFGDADNKGNLGLDSFLDTASSQGRSVYELRQGLSSTGTRVNSNIRDEDASCRGTGLLHGIGDAGEDWETQVC